MATLIDLVFSVCNGSLYDEKASFTARDSQNGLSDLKHQVLADFWEHPLPEELCAALVREISKIKARLVKREKRRNARTNELSTAVDLPVKSVYVEARHFTSFAHDDFEHEALLAIMDIHPDCESFAELAATGKFGGVSTAYKKRSALLARLRRQLVVPDYGEGNLDHVLD